MSNDSITLEIENIGGFKGINQFTLHKGLNIVKAPNATGKTSFSRAFELLCFDDKNLRNKGYYMNLKTDSKRDQSSVTLKGKYNLKRRFRRIDRDLTCVEGEPFIKDSEKALLVSFATPENVLISKMLAGEPIKPFIERFSDSEHYETAVNLLTRILGDYDRQHEIYRADLIRLEQENEELRNLSEELETLEKNFSKLPEINIEEADENQEIHKAVSQLEERRRGISKQIQGSISLISENESIIESNYAQIEMFETRIENIGSDQQRIESQISESGRELLRVTTSKEDIESELKKIDDELRSVRDNFQKRQKYGEEKLCIACGQPLSLKKLQEWDNQLRKAKNDFQMKLKELKRRNEDLDGEITSLKRELQELSKTTDELTRLQRSNANRERTKATKEKELKNIESQKSKIDTEIEKLYSSIDESLSDILKKRNKISDQITNVNARIDARERRIEDLEEKTTEADIIVEKIEFSEGFLRHLKIQNEQIIEAARILFNNKIKEMYNHLGFTDFTDIEIQRDYSIYIRREGFTESWPLSALSTSERITLAVMLLIAGKQEYLPEFPFFVLDELVTSYDPERFKKLKEYISDVTEYVILTELSTTEETGQKVVVE